MTYSGKQSEPHAPTIAIEPVDRIKTLDMRFLVGLDVVVAMNDEKRAKELFEACKKAGVEKVIACHLQDGRHYNDQNGWIEIYERVKDELSN